MATKASTYIKNVGKSLGYSAIDVLEEYNPVISSFIKNNGDIGSTIYKEIKNLDKSIKKASRGAKNNKYVKAATTIASSYKKNLFEDIKSGNFYNKEREEKSMEAAGEAFMSGLDDDFGFDDFDFDDSSSESDVSDTKAMMSMMDEVGEKTSNAIASATARSAEYIVEANVESTNSLMRQNSAIFANIHQGMGNINENISNIMKFFNDATVTHYQNSQTFYTHTEETMKEQTELLKQLVDMEKKRMGGDSKNSYYRNNDKVDFTTLNNYDGAVDLKEYAKYLKNKAKNSGGGFADMLSMLDSMGGIENFGQTLVAAPLRGLSKSAVRMLMGKQLKKSMEDLNTSLSGLFGNLMAGFERHSGGFGIGSKIAQFFGVDTSIKRNLDTSKYEKGPIPFDGITKKAIVDVMPHYLSKIYAAISGNEEDRFDYKSGKYVKISKAKEKYNSIESDASKGMIRDLDYMLNSIASNLNMSDEEKKRFEKEKEKVYKYMLKNGFDKFNRNRRKGTALNPTVYGGNGSDIESKYAQLIQMAYNQLSEQQISVLNSSRISAIDRANREYADLQLGGGSPLGDLIAEHGIKGMNDKEVVDTIESQRRVYTSLPQFTQATLDYLYSINKELSFMRTYGFGIAVRAEQKEQQFRKIADFDSFKPGYNQINLPKNKNSKVTDSNIRQMTDKEFQQAASKAIDDYNKRQKMWDDDNDGFENFLEFMGIDSNKGIGSIYKSVKGVVNAPGNLAAKLVQTVDHRLFDLMFNMEVDTNGEAKGIIPYITKNIRDEFGKLNKWIDEDVVGSIKKKLNKDKVKSVLNTVLGKFGLSTDSIKEYFTGEDGVFTKLKTGLLDSFKSVGHFIQDKFFSIFGIKKDRKKDQYLKDKESHLKDALNAMSNIPGSGDTTDIPNAASGLRSVSKTGVVAVSKGEMIVPPDFDINKISNRLMKENAQKIKYANSIGIKPSDIDNFAEGGEKEYTLDDIEKMSRKTLINHLYTLRDIPIKTFLNDRGMKILNNKGIKNWYSPSGKKTKIQDMYDKKKESLINQIKENEEAQKLNSFTHKAAEKAKGAFGVMKDQAMADGKQFVEWLSNSTDANGLETKVFDSQKVGSFVKDAMAEMKDKFPNMVTGGIIGAGVSTLTGMVGGPLLGAAVGAGTGLLASSDKLQKALFGDDINDGLLPKQVGDFVKKYVPNMGAGAAIGGLASLIPGVPGGPVGGIILGSAIGFATKNDKIKNFLFGEADENGNGGIFDLNKIKKALPSMGLGSIAGAVISVAGGPLGLVPSIMLGAGAGLLSTNNKFREYLFGDDGVLTAYKDAIHNAVDPFKDYAKHQMKTFWNFLKEKVGGVLDNYVAKPLKGFLNKKFQQWFKKSFDSVTNFVKEKILKAPANLLNKISEKSRTKGIKRGYEASMTANERLLYRTENADRFTKGDQYAGVDKILAGMNLEELENARDQYNLSRDARKAARTQLRDANSIMSNIVTDERYVDSGLAYQLNRMYSGKADSSTEAINKVIFQNNNLSEKDRQELYNNYTKALTKRASSKDAMSNYEKASAEAKARLKNELGIDTDVLGNISLEDYLNTEIKDRKSKAGKAAGDARDQFRNTIEEKLASINSMLEQIANTMSGVKETVKDGNKQAAELANPKSKTVFDSKGRPIRTVRDKDGNYIPDTNDSETDMTQNEQEEEEEQKNTMASTIAGIGAASTGLADFLGMNDTVSEGKNTLLNQLTEKLHLKRVFKIFGIVSTALILLGSTGWMDDFVQKIANFLPWMHDNSNSSNKGAYGKRGFNYMTDTDGNSHTVSIGSDGNPIVDDNGLYTDAETGEKFSSNGNVMEKKVGLSFGDLSNKAILRGFSGKNLTPWNLGKNGKRLIKLDEKIARFVAKNSGKGITEMVAGAGSDVLEKAPKMVTNAMGDELLEATSKNLDKVFDVLSKTPVVKKVAQLFDPIKEKIMKYLEKNISKLGLKELGEVLQSVTVVLEIAFIVLDFNKGYQDAYSILGIAKGTAKVNVGERVLAGIIEAVKNAIPYVGIVGNLIPSKVLVNIVCDIASTDFGKTVVCGAFGQNALDNLLQKREDSGNAVSEYNNEHGTDYNIEEYNKNVQNDWTVGERIGNWFSSTKNSIKENGFSNYASKALNDDWSIIKSIINSDDPFAALSDKLGNNDSSGLLGLLSALDNFGGSIKTTVDIYNSATKGDLKGVWTAGWGDMKNPIDLIANLGSVNNRLIGTVVAIPALVNKVISNTGQKMFTSALDNVTSFFGDMFDDIDPNSDLSYWINADKKDFSLKKYFDDDLVQKNENADDITITGAAKIFIKAFNLPAVLLGRLGKMISNSKEAIQTGINIFFGSLSAVGNIGEATSFVSNYTGKKGFWNNAKSAWNNLFNGNKKSGSGSGLFAGRASGVGDGTFVSQTDPKYANQQFNIPGDTKKQTIADSGCGPAVATMAINSLYKKNEVNMSTASRNALKYKMNDGGVSAEYFGDMFNRYGVSSDYYTGRDKAANIYGSLKSGRQVVLLGQDASNKSKNNSPFGPDSHYVLATGISNNGKYIYISDPEGKKANKRYKASNIINRTQLGISAFMGQGSKLNSRRLPYVYFGGGPTGDYIGKYVKKFESGSSGSTTVGSCGNDGGSSFGSYQMIWEYNGRPGAAQQFWDTYYAAKYGKPQNYSELETMWVNAANEDPDGFFANEHQFIQSQFYDVAKSKLSGFFDPDKYSRAMQECIWSWAVHRGAGGAAAGFREACSNAGISNPQTADETKLLTACYDQRQKAFADAGWDVARYKAGQGENSERDIVMGLIGQKPIASDGSTLGTSTATHDSSSSSSSSSSTSSSQNKGFLGELTSAFSRLMNKGYGFAALTGEDDDGSSTSSSVNLDPSGTVGSTIGEKIVNYARQIKDGVNYVYGGDNPPSSTDCSGYTQYVYKQITGADISRGTCTQITSDKTKQVSYADAQPGDLLYWHMKGSDRAADQPSHTGIYLGDNLCIHNSTEGVNVVDNQTLSSNGDMGTGNTLLQVRRLKDSAYAGSGSGLLSRARSYVDNKNRKDIFGIGSGTKLAKVGYVAAGSGVTPQSTKAIVPSTSNNQTAINKLNNISSSTSDSKLIKLISIVVQILGKISDNTDNISNIVQLLTTLVTTTSASGAATSANASDIDNIKQQLMQTVQQSNTRSDDSELMQLIKNVEALARE